MVSGGGRWTNTASAAPAPRSDRDRQSPRVDIVLRATELDLTPVELLATEDFSGACDYAGTVNYNDGFYVGLMDVWQNCGDAGSEFLVVAAEPPDGSYIVLVQIVEVTDADVGAADEVLLSFSVSDPMEASQGG